MPQNLHGHPGVHVKSDQERRAGPPRVMDPDVADTGFLASGGKLPVKVPRLIRSAMDGREDEPVVLPGIGGTEAVGGLALGAELKGCDAYARQRQYGGRARRLGLPVTKLVIGSLELPSHMDFSAPRS